MPGALSTVIIVDKTNEEQYKEAHSLQMRLPGMSRAAKGVRIGSLKLVDCREPPVVCDLAIHFRTPYAVWFAWSRLNVLVASPQEWSESKWNAYEGTLDRIVDSDLSDSFFTDLQDALETRESLPRHMPPLLNPDDCPPISILTLVHNRPKFIENACLNLLHSDYPRDKIEWVVVDDSDPDQSASNRIVQFGEKFAPGTLQYIPLDRKSVV